MQRSNRFCLGNALVGGPPAPGYAAQMQHAPDAWLRSLSKHQGAAGFFLACKAGFHWRLRQADKPTLTLDTTAEEQAAGAWSQRARALQGMLSRQAVPAVSDGPTQAAGLCLRVTVDDSPHSIAACSALSALLCGDSSAVTELYVRHATESEDGPNEPVPNPLFPPGTVYPSLTSLTLDACPYAAPAPASVPSVRQFTTTRGDQDYWDADVYTAILRSTALLLPQLTHLTVNYVSEDIEWSHRAHNLTHFETEAGLCDELRGLLLNHAPQLRFLSVSNASWVWSDFSQGVWGVERLTYANSDIEVLGLEKLPKCRTGRMEIVMDAMQLGVPCEQGFDRALVARFPEWLFTLNNLCLNASGNLSPAQYPTALTNALQQLGQMQLTKPVNLRIEYEWHNSAGTLQPYLAALPRLTQQGFSAEINMGGAGITDELLGVYVASPLLPLPRVTVQDVRLRSAQHAEAAWPWGLLTIDTFDITQLLRMPDPAGEGAPRTVACSALLLGGVSLQVNINQLVGRLAQMHWDKPSYNNLAIHLQAPQDTAEQPAVLRTQLHVLQALRFSSPSTEQAATVRLCGWRMTRELVTELQGLPHWQCRLSVRKCKWPDKSMATLVLLDRSVPKSYTVL